MKYYHVDVFSNKKFSGNGLTIFPELETRDKKLMQTITREMRQFESIFFYRKKLNNYRAFIFTMEEELDFAGHPVLGAAALIHQLYSGKTEDRWEIELNEKSVSVKTKQKGTYFSAEMNQGKPEFGEELSIEEEKKFLSYLNLLPGDQTEGLKMQIVSTGLPYLIIPVKTNSFKKVKVKIDNLQEKLLSVSAKFFYVLDTEKKRGRTWDNSGLVEDAATGSAAGPVGAYLIKNKIKKIGEEIILHQGEFLDRKSELKIIATGNKNEISEVFVSGDVINIAEGELFL